MEREDRFAAIKNLLQILNEPLVVFDIGVRWGFQEHWKQLGSLAQLIGMDADEQEIQSLNNGSERVEFIPKALGAQNGYGTLYITQDPACSSLYPPDDRLIRNRPTLDVTRLVSTKKVEISTLDDWAQKRGISEIDFLKLDVQEAELDILQGAEKALQSVRMLEVEVEFNPIYQGAPLFGDVDRFLRQRGFSLWRMKNYCHYSLPDKNLQSVTAETIKYDFYTAYFEGKQGQLYWADAYYVRDQIAYDTPCLWEIALKDACMAGVLGFDDLFSSSLKKVLSTCPEAIAQRVKSAFQLEDPVLPILGVDSTKIVGEPKQPVSVRDLQKEIEQLKSELEIVRRERDLALEQVSDFYQTGSYRITRPLRAVDNFVRRLLKKS